jgi:hypothetical protein
MEQAAAAGSCVSYRLVERKQQRMQSPGVGQGAAHACCAYCDDVSGYTEGMYAAIGLAVDACMGVLADCA